jgi:spoIIIJ-associated protein
MDEQIQHGQQWLEKLLELMGIPIPVNVGRIEGLDNNLISCWLTIEETKLSSEQIDLLIGKKGETIDSIQYLANALLNIGVEEDQHRLFTVELNGYRIRRQAELFAIAQKVAAKVRLTGEPEELKYLSSAERRQIHSLLQDAQDLETESQGQEPNRRLVVRLR